MGCTNCTNVELNCCSDFIIIGTAPDPLESYYAIIEDVSNGRKIILPVVVIGLIGNLMQIDVTDIQFASNHSYEMYLVIQDDVSNNVTWSINGTDVDCLQVRFNKHHTSFDVLYTIETQTITL